MIAVVGNKYDDVVDLVCYVFESKSSVVKPKALRLMMRAMVGRLLVDERVHLDALWEVLEEQPGFDPAAARAAFLTIAARQEELPLPVELPRQVWIPGLLDRYES